MHRCEIEKYTTNTAHETRSGTCCWRHGGLVGAAYMRARACVCVCAVSVCVCARARARTARGCAGCSKLGSYAKRGQNAPATKRGSLLGAHCWKQLPGPGGADRAFALFTGAAATPRLFKRQRKFSMRTCGLAASVAARGLHSRSPIAASFGQTVCWMSDASTVSPHISPCPPRTRSHCFGSSMSEHGSLK